MMMAGRRNGRCPARALNSKARVVGVACLSLSFFFSISLSLFLSVHGVVAARLGSGF